MRRLPVCVLAVLLLLSAVVAQAQPAEPPKLGEFRIYFLHLAAIDAAADKAEAEGTPGDTTAWRRFEQENTGLTETEAALLKDVAFRCNRTLEENLEGQAPMVIVRQAVDELRSVLGPAAFEAVSQRIQTFLRPAITTVPAAVATGEGTEDEEEIPVEVEAFAGPSVSVFSLLFKLQDGNFMANCGTTPNDTETLNKYAGGVTMVCELRGGELTGPVPVPCGSSPSSTTCSQTYPPAPPNRTRVLLATHGLRMKLLTGACYSPVAVYDDPLAFCRTETSTPNFIEDGDVFPIQGGIPRCWDPQFFSNVCRIAYTSAPQISYIDISPRETTVYAGSTVKFSSAGLQATWTLDGPGQINNTGLYTAPASVAFEQTVKVKACDNASLGDCATATIALKPLQVQVAPSPVEVLPGRETTLTATLVPSVPGQAVIWTMTPNVGTLAPSGNAATYTAPAYNDLAGNTEITVTACLSPASGVCGTATVIVPKLLFRITAPKTKLELNESVQLTAFLQGSNVTRSIFWVTPPAGSGTLSVINPADGYIRLYKAPGAPPFSDVVIKACLVEDPGFCAELPLELPKSLWVTSFESDTGRWQAGTLTDFTITGEGFRPELQIEMGGLPMTVTSMTETVIKGKVRILVPATGVPLTMNITYPDGTTSATTRSPKPVEPATVAVSPGTAEVAGGGSKVFDSVCRTSTTQPCTSLEIPSWSASQGSVNPATGLSTTYSAPASVESEGSATVTACWSFGGQSKCGFAGVSLKPNGPIVSVTPETASVEPGKSQPFTAQVTNDQNTAVTWSIQPQLGSITQGGVYTAPPTFGGAATVTVTATSVANSSRKDTATVTLVPTPLSVTSTGSPSWVYHGTTISWTATASGGSGTGRQFAVVRKVAGSATWSAPAWQTSNVLSWIPGPADVNTWDIAIWVKDSLTPAGSSFGASSNPGQVRVLAPLTVSCSASPANVNPGTLINWTATPNGGDAATIRYAFFRKKVGTTTWIPDVTAASWQVSNKPSWTPASTDLGTWEFSIWVKDVNTPANANTYGFSSWCNPGPTQVVAPLTLTSTASPVAAYSGQPIKWTMTATGGVPGTLQYAWNRRRAGTADWIGSGWQTSNEVIWTPTVAEAGATWDFSFLVKDSLTTPTQNTYGYAAWYNPASVPVVTPPTVTCTASPSSSTYGNTLSWTATVSGGTGVGRQYALFRKRSGVTAWTPPVTAPSWQPGNVMTWTPGSGDAGAWDFYIWVKDNATPSTMNSYGYAVGCNPGGVEIVGPLGVTSTASPALVTSGNPASWTATATGGVAASTQFAVVRRVSGTTTWSAPVWQSSGNLSWTPASTDVNTWEISIRVRDGSTPAGAFAASYNPGNVRVVAPLSVTGTSSPSAYYHSNSITWTATGNGGTGVGRQYALFRKKVGAASWIPDVTAPAWSANNQMSWTPASTDVGTWEIVVWFKDANTPSNANGYGYGAYYNAGPVQVYAHPTVSGTGSPSSVSYGTTISWTATGSGGIGSAKQYALYRKKVGTSNWIPALTSPGWQPGNVLTWTPGSADVGTWEIFVWMKDANTPSTMNTYGHAAWYNPGLVEVTGPLTLSSCTPSPVSSNHGKAISWTAYVSGGHPATIQYALFRKRAGTTTWIPAQTTPAWQSGSVMTWTPGSADVGGWDISIWIRDGNTAGSYAASCSPGQVQVTNPLSLSIQGTPSSSPYGTTITWTATATGGHASTIQYALFRKKVGTSNWIPSIYSPAWQSSRYLTWTPTEDEVGTWEIYAWVKDSSTSPTQLTYGYAAGANGGAVEITAPIYQDADPIGWVDGVDNQWIWGWACDPDYPWESNRVDIWSTSWEYLGSADASDWSSTPINNACGGGSAHYFSFYHGGSIPSGTHFWVWSIDLPYSTPGGVNVPIGGFNGSNEFVMP